MSDVVVRIPTVDQVLPPAFRRLLLDRLAAELIGRIKRRTGRGLDVDGRAFTPYSARYARARKDAGRKAQPVTLLLSGAMLNSMKVLRLTADEALLGFEGTSASIRLGRRRRRVKDRRTGAAVTGAAQETKRRVANALKAAWHDRGEGRNPRRHFFGASKEELAALAAVAQRLVREHLARRGP